MAIFNTQYGAGVSGQSEEVYFTEETRIGTWIDGKPLYRRVIEAKTPSYVGVSSATIYVFDEEINSVNIYANVKKIDGQQPALPAIYVNSTSNPVAVCYASLPFIEGKNLKMGVYHTNYTNSDVTAILEYTKNTD